jgi:cyclopropane-fatty-acyl-phospholipid synthase
MSILDLGCGWGSFSLYAAGRFPAAKITAVSNSNTQREYIEGEAKKLGFNNLKVIITPMQPVMQRVVLIIV